jgi:2,4'-dihydroxyacetophenone dioxygenase
LLFAGRYRRSRPAGSDPVKHASDAHYQWGGSDSTLDRCEFATPRKVRLRPAVGGRGAERAEQQMSAPPRNAPLSSAPAAFCDTHYVFSSRAALSLPRSLLRTARLFHAVGGKRSARMVWPDRCITCRTTMNDQIDRSSTQRSDNMTRTLSPVQLNTLSGAPLPLLALRQGKLLTVNIDQIPLLKDAGGPGIHLQPLRLDPERGEWVFLAVWAPGCSLPLHYHTGPAQVYTFKGRWLYREYPDQPQTAGSYLYEPAGSVHTFYCPEDNTEDTVVLAWIEGAQVQFNEDGTFFGMNDAVSIQHVTETVAAKQGNGPVGYIHGGATRVINS